MINDQEQAQNNTGDMEAKFAEEQSGNVEVILNSPKKFISPLSSILILPGAVIGTGVFMSAGTIAQGVPSIFYVLLLWVICGIVCLLAGLCYAELGLVFPSCGGEYVYFTNIYHEAAGFSFMFCQFFFIRPISIAILILFTAESLLQMGLPSAPFWESRFLSCGLVLLLLILHCFSNYLSIKFNDILTWSKFLCMGIIIGLAIYKLCLGEFEYIKDWGFTPSLTASGLSKAIYNCMWAFDGFNSLAYMLEEMKNPSKHLVSSSVIGLGLVTALYVVVNLSYFIILGIAQVSVSQSVAKDVVSPYFLHYNWIMVLFVALSALGSAHATAYCSAKIYLDCARKGHLPTIIATVHKKRETPIPSLIIQAFLTIFYLLVAPDIDGLIIYFSGASWVFYAATVFAVAVLRYKNIPREEGFRMNYVLVIITGLVSSAIVVLGFTQEDEWLGSIISIGIIFVSIPVYWIFIYKGGIIPKHYFSMFEKSDKVLMNVMSLELESNKNSSESK